MSKNFHSPYYPPSKPRETVGGIRAKSARGKIAETWWSTRFIEVLEGMGMGSRLSRGRNYARRGQVVSLDLSAGQVAASVQGSRSRPYRVRIGVPTFGKDQWLLIEERLAGDAWFVAQLLSGEMPKDIEALFEGLGLSLFPRRSELSLDCSCPDWEVPCKHLAAVFYLLAERFDAYPFDMLAWRGRDRVELLGRLHASSPAEDGDEAVPLAELLTEFWVAPEVGAVGNGAAETEQFVHRAAAITRISDLLPPVGLKIRGRTLPEILEPVYDVLREPGASDLAD